MICLILSFITFWVKIGPFGAFLFDFTKVKHFFETHKKIKEKFVI